MNKIKKVKDACGECKDKNEVKESNSSMDEIRARRERVEKVIELFRDVHYVHEKDREDAIISFTKANLTLEEIDMLLNPLRPSYNSDVKESQISRRGMY